MTKKIFCSLLILSFFNAKSQPKVEKKIISVPRQSNAVAVGITLPVSDFNSTHSFGIIAEYSYSNQRFGKFSASPKKKLGFTASTGIAYYFGRKEIVSNYPYKYPGFIYLHTYGGLIYTPLKSMNFIFTAGPAIGLYNGLTHFYIGSKVEGCYFISKRIALSPGISLMKKSNTDPLWSATLKVTYPFKLH